MAFEGRVAIVTGGAGGLGAAVTRELHTRGAAVVIADLADAAANRLVEDLGSRAVYVPTDVLSDESVGAAIAAAGELGTLRYAVIAHGGFGVAERLVNRDGVAASLTGFRKTLDLYLTGTYNTLRLVASALAALEPDDNGERGAIVTTASIAGYEGQIGQTAYAAAKAGVIGLTLAGARDLSSVAVRLNTVAPGTMLTPALEKVGPEMLAKFAQNVPFPKRLGDPREYAMLVCHLLENTYINGEVIRLDGAQRFAPR